MALYRDNGKYSGNYYNRVYSRVIGNSNPRPSNFSKGKTKT